MSELSKLLERAGIRDKERVQLVESVLDGMGPEELRLLSDEMAGRAAEAERRAEEEKARREKSPVDLYRERRAAKDAEGMPLGEYMASLGKLFMDNYHREDAGPLLDGLCEERQALILAGVPVDRMSKCYGGESRPGTAWSRSTITMGKGFCAEEVDRISPGAGTTRSYSSKVTFDAEGKLREDVERSYGDAGPRKVTAYAELHTPSPKGEVFRRTLLDLGWPWEIVDGLETQADVVRAREEEHLGHFATPREDPVEAMDRAMRQAAAETVYLRNVRTNTIAAKLDRRTGGTAFEVPVDYVDNQGNVLKCRLPVAKSDVSPSTRKQGSQDVPNRGFSDVRLGVPGTRLKLLAPRQDGSYGTIVMTPEDILADRERAMGIAKKEESLSQRQQDLDAMDKPRPNTRYLSTKDIV